MARGTDDIRHDGFVDSIDGSTVYVRIVQSSACSGCQAKSLCKVSEAKEKVIEVTDADSSELSIGQQVCVVGSMEQGMKAVLLAFGLPLVLLLAVVIVCKSLGVTDGIAAISALTILIPYYLVLLLCRQKLTHKFQFKITAVSQQPLANS